ncbi:MAG TPA: serine hydrolase domain-containing protein [Mycobacteriales bacterium]|nr:serine hydrolase domain-containing protein [Mycobacteriales bacterium]
MELEHDAELAAIVVEKAAEHRTPGLGVGVLYGGRTFVATHGVTSTADPLEVDADTLFMIGSTTKTLTATALMHLVDEGRLALTDLVVDHLPDFEAPDIETTKSVTIGQLLNHTAGWRGDVLPSASFADTALAEAVQLVAEGPQEVPAGRYASYNNAALMVAGRVLEVLTGQSYEKAVTELVLTPLGLTNTFFLPWEVANRRLAVGHILRPDVEEAVPLWPISRGLGPAGAAISSLRDQLTYARYHLDGTAEAPPLSEKTRLLMQQPTSEMRSILVGVGITWLLSDYGGVRLVSHGGNVSNLQTSAFHLAPECGFGLVVMSNSAGGAAAGRDLLAWCLEHFAKLPPRSPLPQLELTDALIREYAGIYDLGPWTIAIETDAGKLTVRMVLPDDVPETLKTLFDKPPAEMVLVGPDQLAPAADPVEATMDFIRAADGSVKWVRHGMRLAPRKDGS